MRETLLLGFAVFIGCAGAVITALPVIAWRHRRRRRKALYAVFLHALEDGQLRRTLFIREKALDGAGFADRLAGTAGTVAFTLARRFRPFKRIDPFWLHIEGETFVFNLNISEDDRHPIVRSYLTLRWESPRDAPSSEAS